MLGGTCAVLKLRMTSGTHQIWLIAKLERGWIAGDVVTVRIMASPAGYRRFLKALRPLQRFHHECCLAEAAVFVETFAGEFSKGLAQHVAKKRFVSHIVQLAGCSRLANRRLHMALCADGHKFSII